MQNIYESYIIHILLGGEVTMGIVKISDSLHQELREASASMMRSINAQAEYWIMVGMLAETHPELAYQDIVREKLLPDLTAYLAASRRHE